MNTESETSVDDVQDESQDEAQAEAQDESLEGGAESAESSSDEVHAPDFQPMTDTGAEGPAGDLSRLQNIQIMVTAELGRVEIPIQQLMSLTKGSVLELDQSIDSLVDLVAQGVTLASGEVVVVDGRFAIRIL